MKKTLYFNGAGLLAVMLAFGMVGCKVTATSGTASSGGGTSTGGSGVTVVVPGSSSDLVSHTFTTICSGGGTLSTNANISFSSTTAGQMAQYFYYSANCTGAAMVSQVMPFTVTLGTIDSTTGRIDVTITPNDTIVTPLTANGTSLYNSQVTNGVPGICGLTNWATGTPKNMTTVACSGERLLPVAAGATYYASFWLTGTAGSLTFVRDSANRTGCGGQTDLSSGARCTTASTNFNEDYIQTQ